MEYEYKFCFTIHKPRMKFDQLYVRVLQAC